MFLRGEFLIFCDQFPSSSTTHHQSHISTCTVHNNYPNLMGRLYWHLQSMFMLPRGWTLSILAISFPLAPARFVVLGTFQFKPQSIILAIHIIPFGGKKAWINNVWMDGQSTDTVTLVYKLASAFVFHFSISIFLLCIFWLTYSTTVLWVFLVCATFYLLRYTVQRK